MKDIVDPWLFNLLACPYCGNSLIEIDKQLECIKCKRKYENRNGIPILFPSNINSKHLFTEEQLAEMMRRDQLTRKEKISSIQWELSKRKFWGIVKNKVGVELGVKSIINVGCGYDSHFREFDEEHYKFVNFDMTCFIR